jgi:hypothetical protein
MQPALWDNKIESVGQNADPRWMNAAYAAVTRVAGRQQQFTTDEVWQELHNMSVASWAVFGVWSKPETHDHRAMGAVMRKAKKIGVCEPSGNYRTSTRDVCHGRPVRVWRSLL